MTSGQTELQSQPAQRLWSKEFILFLLLTAILLAVGVFWGLPSEFSAAPDSIVPQGPIAFFAKYRDPDISEKYPAFHQVLLAAPDAVIVVGAKATGNLGEVSSAWPYGLRDPVGTFSLMIVVARLVAVAMTLGILVCIRRLALDLQLGAAGWVALVLFAASGVTTYYARVGNFDIPYVFWFSCALCALCHYLLVDPRPRLVMWTAAFGALAVATKDQAAGLSIGLLIALLMVQPKGLDNGWRDRFCLTFRAGLLMAVVYFLAAVLPHPVRWLHHIQVWLLDKPAVSRFVEFENTITGHTLLFGRTLLVTSQVISGSGVVLAAIGVVSLMRQRRWRELGLLLIPVAVYYLTIITPIRFVYARFMVPAAVPLCVLAAVGTLSLIRFGDRAGRVGHLAPRIAISLILIGHFLTGYLPVTYIQLDDTKARLATAINETVPLGSTIIWRPDGKHTTPNADVYQNYKLAVERDTSAWGNTFAHVMSQDTAGGRYLLTTAPLSDPADARLVKEVRYPAWLNDMVRGAHCLTEFYLYEQTAPIAESENPGPDVDELSLVDSPLEEDDE